MDAGSGYDSQSDAPVHVGLGRAGRVDVRVTVAGGGTPVDTWLRGVDPRDHAGRALVIRTMP